MNHKRVHRFTLGMAMVLGSDGVAVTSPPPSAGESPSPGPPNQLGPIEVVSYALFDVLCLRVLIFVDTFPNGVITIGFDRGIRLSRLSKP